MEPGTTTADGRFLYTSNSGASTINQYSTAGGVLTPLSPATATSGSGPAGMARIPAGPGVSRIQQVPALANSTSLTWKVVFNRPVTGVEATDFSLGPAPGSWTIDGVTGSGAGPYTVTARGGSGAATLTLSIGANSVADLVGAPGPAVTRYAPPSPMDASAPGPTASAVTAGGGTSVGTAGTWSLNGLSTTLSYQWQVSSDGATWSNAANVSNTLTYIPLASDIGKALRLKVTGTNSAGATDAFSPSTVVQALPSLLVGNWSSANVSMMSIGANGALGAAVNFTAGTNPRASVATSDGRFAYVANQGSGTIGQYAVSPAGSLAPLSPSSVAMTAPWGLVMTPDNRYVLAVGTAGVRSFSVAIDGQLSAVSGPVAAGTGGRYISMHPSGSWAFVTDDTGKTINVIGIGSNGTLSVASTITLSGTPAPGPTNMTVSPDGRFLYIADASADVVRTYSIDAASGALTAIGTGSVSTGATDPYYLTTSRDGAFLYVGYNLTAQIGQFAINSSTGALTPLSPAAVGATGQYPEGLVAGLDGTSLYSATYTGNAIAQWNIAAPLAADYGRELYAALRQLDRSGAALILVETPPAGAEWEAARDRLRRAAAAFP